MNKTLALTEASRRCETIDLGLKDERGRAVGYFISRQEGVVVDATPEQCYYASLANVAAGTTVYEARVQPTRDGVGFGACTPTIRTFTPEAREAEIARKLADGRKRYAKKYAR